VIVILLRGLLAAVREAKSWVRAILRGMIAADLVIGAAVGRTQVDVFELAVLKTEGDSNKAARAAGGAGGGTPRQFRVDRAIVKGGVFHDRVRFTIGHLAIFRDLYRPLAEVVDG